MTGSSNVAIFWDYENCALPAAEPSYAIVNKIRRLAHQYGSVKTFRAYLEYPEQSSLKSVSMRSELQSCGVSLIDCSHNGRKDVADKMMMIDMMAYAIDNPAPATIILISQDRDFVYAVSILSLRQYNIVLLAPKATYGGLKAQADAVYNWPEDFLPGTPVAVQPTATHAPSGHRERPNRAASTSLSEAWQNQLPTPPTGSATPQLSNRDINPTSNAGDTFNGSTSGTTIDDARGRTTPAMSGSIIAPQPERITESLSRTATPVRRTAAVVVPT
ncbi:NYN domain-containing protein [Trametes elegans]|nr:NYN domain-containing protein [Trametes elegans]